MLKLKSKPGTFLAEQAGRPIFSVGGLLAAVGYVPVGSPVNLARYPFLLARPGRTNLTGNARLNGYSFSPSRTDVADYASTDILSSGLYQFDWVIGAINPTNDAVELFVYDRGDNVAARGLVFLVQAGAPAGMNATNRMDIPVSEGQRIALRRTASNGNGMQVSMSWRFLNPYLGNTPLSLAQIGVQNTEPGSVTLGGGSGGAGEVSAPGYGGGYVPDGGGDGSDSGGPSQ